MEKKEAEDHPPKKAHVAPKKYYPPKKATTVISSSPSSPQPDSAFAGSSSGVPSSAVPSSVVPQVSIIAKRQVLFPQRPPPLGTVETLLIPSALKSGPPVGKAPAIPPPLKTASTASPASASSTSASVPAQKKAKVSDPAAAPLFKQPVFKQYGLAKVLLTASHRQTLPNTLPHTRVPKTPPRPEP